VFLSGTFCKGVGLLPRLRQTRVETPITCRVTSVGSDDAVAKRQDDIADMIESARQ